MRHQQHPRSTRRFLPRLAAGAASTTGAVGPLTGAAAGLSLLLLASCGAPPPGPILSAFGASSYEITDGQTIHITATLSDADMGPLKAGIKGILTDGADKVYGTFSSTMPGILTYDISWAQLDMEKRIAFDQEEKRTYTAQFIDDYGNRIERQFTVRLHCGGDTACEGRCVKLGAACPISKNLQCLSGQCGIGCIIGNRGYLDGALNPADTCQACNWAQSQSSFTQSPPYTACAPGLGCSSSGQCTEPFRLRELPKNTYSIDQVIAPAPDVRIAVADTVNVSSESHKMLSVFSNTGSFMSTPFARIKRLHAVDANTVFRYSDSGLDVSLSGGRGFSQLTTNRGRYANALWASSASDIWFSASDPPTSFGHYHSTNGGASFTRLTGVGDSSKYIFGTSASNVFFISFGGGTLYRTTNGGASFETLNLGFSIYATVGWGTSPSNVYLGTTTGLYFSNDNADTLTKVTPPSNSRYPNAEIVSIHGCSAKDVFIANSYEIWHSTDGQKATLVTSYAFDPETLRNNGGWHSVACTAPGKMVAGGSAPSKIQNVAAKPILIESL